MSEEVKRKKVVLIDFDGTLNSYKSGFQPDAPAYLPDPPLPGAIAFLRRVFLSPRYEPVIFSTRLLNRVGHDFDRGGPELVNAEVEKSMADWFRRYGLETEIVMELRMTCIKVPCSLIIDDNAFRFEGKYPDPSEMDRLTKGKR